MRYLKKTFLEQAGIYLYKCHKCRTFIDFSQKTCSKCNTANYYYDPTVQINQKESVRCYELLNRFKNSDDRFKETFLDDIMSGKIATIPPQSKEVSGKEEIKEVRQVSKLEEKKNTAEQEEVKEVNVSLASNRESSQKEFMIKSQKTLDIKAILKEKEEVFYIDTTGPPGSGEEKKKPKNDRTLANQREELPDFYPSNSEFEETL